MRFTFVCWKISPPYLIPLLPRLRYPRLRLLHSRPQLQLLLLRLLQSVRTHLQALLHHLLRLPPPPPPPPPLHLMLLLPHPRQLLLLPLQPPPLLRYQLTQHHSPFPLLSRMTVFPFLLVLLLLLLLLLLRHPANMLLVLRGKKVCFWPVPLGQQSSLQCPVAMVCTSLSLELLVGMLNLGTLS
jgi:hypothetical protein